MFGPVLKGEKVTLRPGRESDAELFVRWFADMQVTRMLGRRMAVALYQEQEFLKKIGESRDDVWWMIEAEGMALRTRYAFRELNLHKLMTEVNAENIASRKALERSGYRTAGTRREQEFREGKWHDRWLGEVLRSDWEKSHP
jgi:RimJ/RimL family protein N-acetyltransferase